MKNGIAAFAIVTVAGFAAAANADLTFSFADPVPGRQLTLTANAGGPGVGLLTYDTSARLAVLVDGSTEPTPFESVFSDARLSMNLLLGPAVTVAGVTTASVTGTFTVFNAFAEGGDGIIVKGTATDGAFVRVGGTNSILFSSDTGFAYTAGDELTALLDPHRVIAEPMEAVFTVTGISVTGGGALTTQSGAFRSFTANASFSGNSATVDRPVPTPGAAALALAGGLATLRRRRKPAA